MDMSDERKGKLHALYRRETFFLPPLKMILTFSDKEFRQNGGKNKDAKKREDTDEKAVARLIEKLSEKDE